MTGRTSQTVSAEHEPSKPAAPPPERPSVLRVVASALAAMTTTALLSTLGVAGTIIGAALASVVTVLANFVYSASIYHTAEKVTAVVPARLQRDRAAQAGRARLAQFRARPAQLRARLAAAVRRVGRRRLAATCATAFLVVIGTVTVVELVAGKPLSDLTRGRDGSGTTLFGTTTPRPPLPEETELPDREPRLPGTGPADVPSAPDVRDAPDPQHRPAPEPAPTAPVTPSPDESPTAPAEEPVLRGTEEPAPDEPAPASPAPDGPGSEDEGAATVPEPAPASPAAPESGAADTQRGGSDTQRPATAEQLSRPSQ